MKKLTLVLLACLAFMMGCEEEKGKDADHGQPDKVEHGKPDKKEK